MSYVRIWIHLVWSTKYRKPVLTKTSRELLFSHILDNAREKNIHIDCINGAADHVHVLIRLQARQSLVPIVQQLKGESANWANKQSLLPHPFEWQREYFAESIRPKDLTRIRKYIMNQEKHHADKNEMIPRYESNC